MGRHQRKINALRSAIADLISARRSDRDRIRSLDERLRERRDPAIHQIDMLESRVQRGINDYRWLNERHEIALDKQARAESAHAKTLTDLRQCQAWLLIAVIVAIVLAGCVLGLRHEATLRRAQTQGKCE